MHTDHVPFTYVPPPKTCAPKPGRHWVLVIAPYVAAPAALVALLVWWVR